MYGDLKGKYSCCGQEAKRFGGLCHTGCKQIPHEIKGKDLNSQLFKQHTLDILSGTSISIFVKKYVQSKGIKCGNEDPDYLPSEEDSDNDVLCGSPDQRKFNLYELDR